MLTRERCPMSAALLLPPPAPLPSLRDALQRRAAIFGPVEVEEDPAPRRRAISRRTGLLGAIAACGALTGLCGRSTGVVSRNETPFADARLIGWCDDLPKIDAALSDLFTRAPDLIADARIDALSTQWSAATDGIERTPAQGPAGIAAKARAVQHLAQQSDMEVATPIAASLAADVLRMSGAAA